MEANEFKCDSCKEIFEKNWSDLDAKKEGKQIWGEDIPQEEMTEICDDCFEKIMKVVPNSPGYMAKAKEIANRIKERYKKSL